LRIIMVAANALLAVSAPGPTLSLVANGTLALAGVGMTVMLVARVAGNLSRLSQEEPLRRAVPDASPLTATQGLSTSAPA
jgi:hypothetical protein